MRDNRYTLYGDLDGLTVAQIIEFFSQFPKDAVLDVATDYYIRSDGGGDGWEQDYFVIVEQHKR